MIKIYSKDYCPYCSSAKAFLDSMNLKYEEIDVTNDRDTLMEVVSVSGMMTVPQIFAWELSKENLIGGYDDMMKLHEAGKFLEKVQ